MAIIEPFERYANEYESWFTDNHEVYQRELAAVADLLPRNGLLCEIGIGSGKFALPFSIGLGIDPSLAMARLAKERGISVALAVAEALPFRDATFDCLSAVTSLCFFDDIKGAFKEMRRVLVDHGSVILGFVDAASELGRRYLENRNKSRFYGPATFYSTGEILALLEDAGFGNFKVNQAVFPGSSDRPFSSGYGEGSFIALRAWRL